jgi:membrane peptidoglycan carboxypeptidase
VQRPGLDDPIANPENATLRRNQVLQRMFDLGHITEQELADISPHPVQVQPGVPPPNGCIDAALGGFFCAYVLDYLTGTLGLTSDEIDNGGLTISTTLRPDMQTAGDQAVLNTLPMGDELAAMYTAVEPGTGHLLAMSVNRRYGCAEPDCESVILNAAYSQGAGSTYKTFVAAAALERGFSQYYTLTTSNPYVSRVYKDGRRPYDVENVGSRYPATLDLERALYMSSNTYFLALEDALGSVEGPVRMAERMGMNFVKPPADRIVAENNGSFTFGPYPTSPLDLATAYATLAANGTRCEPKPVAAILDRNGKPLENEEGEPVVREDNCTPEAISPGVATTLNQMLRKDVEPGFPGQTGARAYVPEHQIAGKTGTSQENYSIAFVGYTPQYAASVMVLNPKRNQEVGGFGGGKGATIWHDAMAPILTGQPMVPFPPADPVVQNGNTRVIPSCDSVRACQSALQAAGFRSAVSRIDSNQPEGTLLGTSPPAGGRAVVDQVVTILVSNGSGYVPPAPEPAPEPAPAPENPGGGGGPGGGPGNGNGNSNGNGNGNGAMEGSGPGRGNDDD